MANNFKNAVIRNISADSTLPTTIYSTPDSKKSIAIEIDVANKSTAGVVVTVQLEDESANLAGTTAQQVSTVATDATGNLTTAAVHGLVLNDRIIFTNGTDPSFTNASLPPSADAALSETRMYYIQKIQSTTIIRIAETRNASSALTFDTNGASVVFTKIHIADIIKDAPVPVGGTLKVISGQKLVLESTAVGNNDKIYAYCSSANNVDCIASVLEDVS
tara:strand:+ start:240 stop:896 length:657 start_codon:yes stop_codon:yes gene_type:complete